jgi:predicted TIM-barrel fold metal-dependent hydrolase
VYDDEALRPWFDALLETVPKVRLFDAHTHTGANDPDGSRCSVEELTRALELAGARAVVFTMHEPNGYPPANDRILSEAEASGGRLVAFCRLDPRADPVAEAERCLDRGARGLKLHPRAERFALDDPAVDAIFALADERRLPVVIHAGRGIPALGRHVLELAERHPRARPILAHAGLCDLGWIWRRLDDHPNVFFDTAWWSASDLMALFALVPPGRILWASDAPYGTPIQQAVLALRCALEAGLSREQLDCVAGRQIERLLAGADPLEVGPAPGPPAARDVLLERVQTALVSAIARIMAEGDPEEATALARLACEVGEEAPEAPVCRSVLALLDRYERRAHVGVAGGAGVAAGAGMAADAGAAGPASRFRGLHLLTVAAGVARTPSVALPADPELVAVGERAA